MHKTIIVLLLIALVAIFSGCDCDNGVECDCEDDIGAWQIIETIVLDADTNLVTFDGISDEWEVLEIQAFGTITGPDTGSWVGTYMCLRFNEDDGLNYNGLDVDKLALGEWFVGPSNFTAEIFSGSEGTGFHSVNGSIQTSDLTGGTHNGLILGVHYDPNGAAIHRIDIFNDPDERIIASGSEFILLGLDAH